jgi:flagellar basal-body rod modification protein FlgD
MTTTASTTTSTTASTTTAANQSATAAATSAQGGSTAQGGKGIADNFQAFLSLLTTQLRNQNPTDPLDTNQFTQQLVQFASVEQQLKTNDLLSTMQQAFSQMSSRRLNAASAGSLVGRAVSADGASARLGSSGATWTVDVPAGVSTAKATVKNAAGETVYTGDAAFQGSGSQSFRWDGRRTGGQQAATGETYTISFDAKDAGGAQKTIRTDIGGTVTSIDLSGSEDMAVIDGVTTIPVSKIRTVAGAE